MKHNQSNHILYLVQPPGHSWIGPNMDLSGRSDFRSLIFGQGLTLCISMFNVLSINMILDGIEKKSTYCRTRLEGPGSLVEEFQPRDIRVLIKKYFWISQKHVATNTER